uniref:Pectinesterase inhibitor domain-containing protein n=1 Tax=Oryza brachyantha TaxID=4533 RepID=J3MUW2_ORYBR
MGSSRRRVLAVLVFVVVAIMAADAARPSPAEERLVDCGDGGYESMVYPAMVEKAKETVELLLARLPAGPSPKGPGH